MRERGICTRESETSKMVMVTCGASIDSARLGRAGREEEVQGGGGGRGRGKGRRVRGEKEMK